MFKFKKTNDIFNIKSGTTPDTVNKKFYEKEEVNWLNSGDFHNSFIYKTNKKISFEAKAESNLKEFKVNSIVIAMYGANVGEVGLLKIKTTVNQACAVLSPKKKINSHYYYYYFISHKNKFIAQANGGGQANINQQIISNTYIPHPHFVKQTAIANFLDHQTSKIDKEISLLEKKVDLLDELKQSTIYEAVTKGINLDVKMKDSGIEWIGIIPEHWEVKRLKSISNIKKGQIFNEEYSAEDGMYPYINGGISPSDYSNRYNTLENTIAVSEGGASAGYAQLMLTKYWAGTHCYKINTKYNVKYLYYIFKGYEKHLMSEKTGSAMPNLQKTRFINFCVSFSSDQQEQIRIVTFLEQKESTINKNKNLLIKKIELLKEYKQSIIFEAVTGKILTKEENESNTKR